MQKSPYKFLDSYSKEDRDIFFGRDREIEELHSRVFESKILIIYGTSGTGKSSLINCGLANKFNDSDWLPVNVRRGSDINQSLYESLERLKLTEIQTRDKSQAGFKKEDILKIIRSVYLDHFKPVYLIFDQFEELFIFGTNNEKDELIRNIKKIIDSDLQCKFIFSIREEYLAGITEFEKVIPSFLSNRIRIEKMTRQNAIKVIEGPCQLNDIDVEPGFAEMLLEKLNPDNSDVELTYLQVYLDKIFQLVSPKGEDNPVITRALLDRAGEVKDLLGTFLEEQISQLDDPDSGLIILKSFVSVKGTRHQITEDEVIEYSKTLGKDIDRETVKSFIQKFIRLRILRDKDENNRYELRHDSLANKIYEEITLVEKELLEIRQFLENALVSFDKRDLFLNADDLRYIAPYEDKLFLNERLLTLISQSKRLIRKAKQRRQNVLVAVALTLITVLSFFSIWALSEKSNALKQKQYADDQKNSAIKAKEAADSARLETLISKNLAVEKENQALLAQKQSDDAKKEALAEREYALQQQKRAEGLSVIANEQAQIATEEKNSAELERLKAVAAEAKARQLGFLSLAQNLALKSLTIEKNAELMGLLAVQSFNFNKKNQGKPEDPIIYEALNKAFLNLDSSRHSVLKGSPSEIRVLRERDNGLITADLDGEIRYWDYNGTVTRVFTLPVRSTIDFISSDQSGERIVTRLDDNELLLWDIKSPDIKNLTVQEFKGLHGFVRTVAFCNGLQYLATAGRDSTVIIWRTDANPLMQINSLKTSSVPVAMQFCGADTIIFSEEDGTINLWDIKNNTNRILFTSAVEKTISLGWNNNKKVLIAGCSDGILMLFNVKKDNSSETLVFPSHNAGIDIITFNSDYSLLATSSWDKTIKFYNYHEFFELKNAVGGAEQIKDLNERARSLTFNSSNELVAGLSDKSIRIWQTSSEKLASMICTLVKRNMTLEEWNDMVGTEVPYENTCSKIP
jgi:hypothetical protein